MSYRRQAFGDVPFHRHPMTLEEARGTLRATRIGSGRFGSVNIDLGDGMLRSAASGARIELDAQGLRAYDGGGQTVGINADGSASFTGAVTATSGELQTLSVTGILTLSSGARLEVAAGGSGKLVRVGHDVLDGFVVDVWNGISIDGGNNANNFFAVKESTGEAQIRVGNKSGAGEYMEYTDSGGLVVKGDITATSGELQTLNITGVLTLSGASAEFRSSASGARISVQDDDRLYLYDTNGEYFRFDPGTGAGILTLFTNVGTDRTLMDWDATSGRITIHEPLHVNDNAISFNAGVPVAGQLNIDNVDFFIKDAGDAIVSVDISAGELKVDNGAGTGGKLVLGKVSAPTVWSSGPQIHFGNVNAMLATQGSFGICLSWNWTRSGTTSWTRLSDADTNNDVSAGYYSIDTGGVKVGWQDTYPENPTAEPTRRILLNGSGINFEHFNGDPDDAEGNIHAMKLWSHASGATSATVLYGGASDVEEVGYLQAAEQGEGVRSIWLNKRGGATLTGGSVVPIGDNAQNLGSTNNRWATVYRVAESSTSDRRLKKYIKDIDVGLDFVNALRPRQYKFKKGNRRHYGFVAQEIQELVGEDAPFKDFAIVEDPLWDGEEAIIQRMMHDGMSEEKARERFNADDHTMFLRYDELFAPIVKAIQELTTRLEALEGASA